MADSSLNALDALTRIRYVGQDFATYQQEIEDFLQLYYPDDYNDYVANSMGVALIQIIAWANQNLAFYMNQRTTNLYMATSTSRLAISRLARMLNYDMDPASPSRVDVTVRLANGPYAFPVTIRNGFKFSAEKSLTFEYRGSNPIVYAPGELEKTFEVREGITLTNTFVSNGLENQRFTLAGLEDDQFLAGSSIIVLVGTEQWTEVRRIPFDAEKLFEANYYSPVPEIRFGDGIAGLIPPEGQEIKVTFVATKGKGGRLGQNQVTANQDTLVSNGTQIALEIPSSSASSDGENVEDIRKVKVMAPRFFASQERAITKYDYDALTNTFPGVSKGDAQIIRNAENDLTLQGYMDTLVDSVSGCSGTVYADVINTVSSLKTYLNDVISDTCRSNIVQVSILSSDANNYYTAPTSGLREDLRVYLQAIADAVHTVTVVDGTPKIVPVDITVEIKVSLNAVEDDVLARASDALLKSDVEPYGILILREYGESLYLSDLYKAVRDSQISEGEHEYVNIKIEGPIIKLDSDGNLIIDAEAQEIIQPGVVEVKAL